MLARSKAKISPNSNALAFLFERNFLARYLLKRLTDDCPACGGSIVEKMIMSEEADRISLCVGCRCFFYVGRFCYRILKLGTGGYRFRELIKTGASKHGYSSLELTRGACGLLRGVATFGFLKPLVSSSPISVILELTKSCNLRCPHCYVEALNPSTGCNPNASELDTQEWIDCIDRLDDARVASIVFSGGEPLLRRDFFHIANYASKKGINVSLATNGMLLDRSTAGRLGQLGIDYVEISLLSAKKNLNDAVRGLGSFERSIEAAKYCLDVGIAVGLAITLVRQVKDEIGQFLELAKNVGVDIAVFLNFVPTGNSHESKNLDLRPHEREETLRQIFRKSQLYSRFFRKTVVLQSPDYARVCHDMAGAKESFELKQIGFTRIDRCVGKFLNCLGKPLDYVGGCAAGRFIATISPSGDILPCPFLRLKLGNVLKDRFVDVWESNPILKKLRDRRNWKGQCGECEHKIVCGGCRAVAYAYLNDFLGSDPRCIISAKMS